MGAAVGGGGSLCLSTTVCPLGVFAACTNRPDRPHAHLRPHTGQRGVSRVGAAGQRELARDGGVALSAGAFGAAGHPDSLWRMEATCPRCSPTPLWREAGRRRPPPSHRGGSVRAARGLPAVCVGESVHHTAHTHTKLTAPPPALHCSSAHTLGCTGKTGLCAPPRTPGPGPLPLAGPGGLRTSSGPGAPQVGT